jgi:CheY-like chemotaxis protein
MTSRAILIIEDNETLRIALASYIEEKGYVVHCAGDGREGLEIARREIPAAIIADLMMPHMDGRELAGHLNDDPDTRHIPVIVLTATDMSDSEREESGFVAYLRKPVDPHTLMGALDRVLGDPA